MNVLIWSSYLQAKAAMCKEFETRLARTENEVVGGSCSSNAQQWNTEL